MTYPTYISGLIQVKAYRNLQAHVQQVLHGFNINPTQWTILGIILENKHMRLSEIADVMGVEAPLVTMMTRQLIKEGLLQKVTDHTDNRAKLLSFTDKGLAQAAEIEKTLRASLSKLLTGVSAADMETYHKVLSVLAGFDTFPDAAKKSEGR